MVISESKKKITQTKDIANIMKVILSKEEEIDRMKEHCWVVGVNQKNVIQYIELVSLGSLTCSIVHPREVFRLAIMKGVASIFLVHNHPSGEVAPPSKEDNEITERISEAGKIIAIKLLDHVIIGEQESYYSYASMGLIIQ